MAWVILDYYIQQIRWDCQTTSTPHDAGSYSPECSAFTLAISSPVSSTSQCTQFLKKGSRSNTKMITPVKSRTSLGPPDFWFSHVGRLGLLALSSITSKSNLKIAPTFPVKTQLFAQLPLPSLHSPIHTPSISLTSQWLWCSNLVTLSRSSLWECFARESRIKNLNWQLRRLWWE